MLDSEKSISGQTPGLRQLQRLGKNINGYFGERIDIAAVLGQCVTAATAHAWRIEEIPVGEELSLLALTRPATHPQAGHRPSALRVYISAGIHGDEPAGPLAMRQLLHENTWPAELDLTVLPCLNPAGFLVNRRENPQGLDLNREYPSAGGQGNAGSYRLARAPGRF